MRVEDHDLQTKETDDQERLHLGAEYANKRVTLAVVKVDADRPSDEEPAAQYRDGAESARDINRELADVSDGSWATLGPTPRVEGDDDDG